MMISFLFPCGWVLVSFVYPCLSLVDNRITGDNGHNIIIYWCLTMRLSLSHVPWLRNKQFFLVEISQYFKFYILFSLKDQHVNSSTLYYVFLKESVVYRKTGIVLSLSLGYHWQWWGMWLSKLLWLCESQRISDFILQCALELTWGKITCLYITGIERKEWRD